MNARDFKVAALAALLTLAEAVFFAAVIPRLPRPAQSATTPAPTPAATPRIEFRDRRPMPMRPAPETTPPPVLIYVAAHHTTE